MSENLPVLTEAAETLVNQVEDMAEEFSLSYEDKLFLMDVLVAFFGGRDPSWEEVSGEIADHPKVKKAIKKYFKLNPLQISEIDPDIVRSLKMTVGLLKKS